MALPPPHSIETISIDTIKYWAGDRTFANQQISKYKQNKIIFQSHAAAEDK